MKMKKEDWIIFVYKMHPEPSRYRVSVWRRLKDIGALYLQNSICILPFSDLHQEFVQKLSKEIEKADGESSILISRYISKDEEQKLIDKFNSERNNEYIELVDHGDRLIAEIQREHSRKNYTYGELDENEDELNRLFTWFEKIKKRDFFCADGSTEANSRLTECREIIRSFSEQVIDVNEGSK
jgi:hypothetical protein